MNDKRYVLDANTLISAFLLSENSIPALAYYKAKSAGEIIFSTDTLNEFSDVFIRPKFDRYVTLKNRLLIIEEIRANTRLCTVQTTINACRDSKDNKYLELASDASASCIITGDSDLLVLNPFNQISILTPAAFLDIS